MKPTKALILAVLISPALAGAAEATAPAAEVKPAAVTPAAPAASAPAAVPTQNAPVATASVAAPATEAEKKSGLHMGVDLDHSLGHGTFINSAYYASFGGSLSLAPSYSFALRGIKLSSSARGELSWEYTLPDSENARRVDWSDIKLGLSAPGVLKEAVTGITVSPGVGLSVPISLASRRASTITVLSGNLAFARPFGKLSPAYTFGMARGFHARQYSADDLSDAVDTTGARLCLARPGEPACNLFGTNTQFSISNGLSLGYELTQKLSFSAGLSLVNAFKYSVAPAEPDEFTPKALDSNGNPVARGGFGRSDRLSGSLGVAYQLNEAFGISAGMGTSGAPKTRDNKAFRFPFFDFIGPESNSTQYSLTLSAAL